MAKLDRFLVSTKWDHHYPLSKAAALPRIVSDHAPILLSSTDKKPHRFFRFKEVWLTRDDFYRLVPVWWEELPTKGNNAITFAAKLRHCRKRMKKWCATHFYSISKVKELSEDIQKLDILEEQQTLTDQQAARRKQLKLQVTKVIMEEEILWKTRAKQHWLKEGDGNTKFFHAMANGRRRENDIGSIEDSGEILHRGEDIREYFYSHFKGYVVRSGTER